MAVTAVKEKSRKTNILVFTLKDRLLSGLEIIE
jgi:hypothetical protein